MSGRISHFASWCVGALGLAFVIWYFQLSDFGASISSIGFSGGMTWLFLTLLSRLCLVEVTVRPIHTLGFRLSRIDAFWIGWVRTFANQVVPLSGLALYTREIRKKAKVPWSGIVALSTPAFLLGAAALSVIGIAGTLAGASYLASSALPMISAFICLGAGSLVAATHAGWILDKLPVARSLLASESADAFRRLSACPTLILQITGFHVGAMLLRGARLWLLFATLGADVGISGALLLVVVAEAAALFQITPGGLGLREGAVVGGAVLLGIPAELGALVALIDRLFLVATTTFLAVPGFLAIRR